MLEFLKDDVRKFIEANFMAVLATVNETGQPSTSVIYYTLQGSHTIRFLTKSNTTKNANLSNNAQVAMTIVDKDKPITVSLEGTARVVEDAAKHHDVLQAITKLGSEKLGDYAPIIKLHKGSFVAYEFTPKKGKLTDFTAPLAKTKEQLHDF